MVFDKVYKKQTRKNQKSQNCRFFKVAPFHTPKPPSKRIHTVPLKAPSGRVRTAPKAPSDEGKRSAVAVVNDSPVDCQSRDRAARRRWIRRRRRRRERNKKRTIGRTHIGIYTVLNESFPPQPPPSPLEYIQYSRGHRWLL